MAKQQKTQQYIYKIESDLLRQCNWDLNLPLSEARKIPGVVVALADSQILTWINELNGTEDYDEQSKEIKRQIKYIKKQPNSPKNKAKVISLYSELYRLQYKEDYVCVVMNKKSDYDRANLGFKINGVTYKRLICTTNGVKTSSVVYISDRLHDEIKKRIENGKDNSVKLVPAKLGAYEALAASASIPVSWPKDRNAKIPGGVIVVSDCITKFKTDLINIDTSDKSCEPVITYSQNQDVENNCSDGCSMMLPSLSMRWNGELNGDYNNTMSGCNLRCAWTKGMTFTFDFIQFAEEINGASEENPDGYIITDVWGDKRDVRDAELIVTESQLKLWKCYSSWEDYYYKCLENKYTIRIAKTAPHECDDVRQLNYQFIQSLDLNEDDVNELISPTVDEIKDIMYLNPSRTVVYMCGNKLNDENVIQADNCAKALMVNKDAIKDPYIRAKIKKMISRRIKDAKIGVLDVHGNFQLISGDLYALCEHIFGIEVHGLLKSGEIYSKYWIDDGTDRVLCFRAPMSNKHSIVAQNVCHSEEAKKWFKYIDTCVVVNAWDSMPMALNGFDFDGDLLFSTDNQPLMRRQTNLPALNCIQHNAQKINVTENDVILANKQGFGSKIGSITNKITAITSIMSNFDKDSEEYKALEYRTQCGQALQQEEIDKAKGIIPTPMPKEWYQYSANKIKDDDSDEEIALKEFNQKICANKKPYFFMYNYDTEKKKYDSYLSEAQSKAISIFGMTLEEMRQSDCLTEDQKFFLNYCDIKCPLDMSPSTMNRICWAIEKAFDGNFNIQDEQFDYSIYKSKDDVIISNYSDVEIICEEYMDRMKILNKRKIRCEEDKKTLMEDKKQCTEIFKEEVIAACTNEKVLCEILLDLCYGGKMSKSIVWDVCGNVIISNMLEKNNMLLTYPIKSNSGFLCCGSKFVNRTIRIGVDLDD